MTPYDSSVRNVIFSRTTRDEVSSIHLEAIAAPSLLLVDRLVGWLVDRLVGWLVDRFLGWLVDRLVDWRVDRLVGWRIDRLVGWQLVELRVKRFKSHEY